MSEQFPGCLLIVTVEVDPAVEAEWNRWYDTVHLPDALRCPGVRRGRRYDGILLDPPKFGRGPTGEVWRLEENLAPLLADCRKLLDGDSRFLVLTVYAVRMSALAIGELVRQTLAPLGGTVTMGEMSVREESRGLLLPTAIFARWSRD